ncbi:MAG TPA: hypothetical protein VJT31_20715, partial [Rugosimonospora sp.]|nr:hypothetical protein [Rugosimonospora sp.]
MGAPQYPNTLTVSESVQRTARDLRARIDELTGVAVDAGMARIPLYAGGGEDFGRAYRAGTEQALRGFLDFLEGRTTGTSWREAYRAIGAREHRAGRSLESLHAAIRIGARMGWRQLVDFAAAESLPISAIGEVADAIWAYVDELVDAAAEGYAQAREAESGELERRRLRLLELLVADPPASEEALVAAATAARWQLPRRL